MLKNATYPKFGMDFQTRKNVRFGDNASSVANSTLFNIPGTKVKDDPDNRPTGKLAINGMGRIGVTTFREWAAMDLGLGVTRGTATTQNYLDRVKKLPAKLEIVAMNTGRPMGKELFRDFLTNDSNWGAFPGKLVARREKPQDGDVLTVKKTDKNGKPTEYYDPLYLLIYNKNQDPMNPEEKPLRKVRIYEQRDARTLPWKKHDVDIAIDATGSFTTLDKITQHLDKVQFTNPVKEKEAIAKGEDIGSGAKMVMLSAPPKEEEQYDTEGKVIKDGKDNPIKKRFIDQIHVYGVNHKDIDPDKKIFSAASCTTTCVSPIIKLFNDKFGVESGFVQTTHSATSSQSLVDSPPDEKEKDPGKARASFDATVPATTGAAKTVGWMLKDLDGKLNGLSARVPVTAGSVAYVVLNLKEEVNLDKVKKTLAQAANSAQYKDVIARVDDNTTTRDIIGRHENSLYLENQIQVINKKMVVVPVFYDNEWGFVRSMTDLARVAVAKHYANQGKPDANTKADGSTLATNA